MISYLKIQRALREQISDSLDPFTRNSIYLKIMKVVKVDCKNPQIKQAIEEDVTLYEAMQSMNFKLSKNKDYPTISIMLNALFTEYKSEIIVELPQGPLLKRVSTSIVKLSKELIGQQKL